MSKRPDAYIDVDSTTLRPSPQRIRNILTLEERVAAIRAYDCRPMYTKVAKMFNCSWEQIKNIIANRAAILDFYEATKSAERQNDPRLDEVRQNKITFLGECVYEYIQRVQFHTKADLSEELIRSKAFEFRDVIQIESFVPNKAWINHFKATYNFSLSNRQITLTRTPPASLDLRDIMTYCTKSKLQKAPPMARLSQPTVNNLYRTSTKIALSYQNDATAETLRQRRQRKLSFLERALLEYATRAKFHLKVTLDEELLCNTASSLRDMLKVDNFVPNRAWLRVFKARYEFDTIIQSNLATSTRTPPLSLDLKDILSYCSRLEKNSQIGAADGIKSNGGGPSMHTSHTLRTKDFTTKTTSKRAPTISVVPKSALMPMINIKINSNNHIGSLRDAHKPLQELKTEIIDLDCEEQREDLKPKSTQSNDVDNNDDAVHSAASKDECQPPALKIRKIETMCATSTKDIEIVGPHSPGHWSESSDKNDDEELPKVVRTYADALKLLKPLEEFAMLEENFRAIGLLEQLEGVFKNPPKKSDYDD